MSESGGMNVNRLTAGGQNVATDVKGNITTLRPAGSTTAMNLNWDSDNKLRSADIDANGTADVNFQYDALGRRVARSGTGGSVVYVQMDQQTIADYPVGGAATTPTFRYVFASYIDEPVVRKTAGTGGTLVYFHRNHQYSVTAVTTSTGSIAERYAYSAYGQPTILDPSGVTLPTSNFSIHTSYTGREWDATLGLHHFRARWMSPNAGRFLQRDPVGWFGGYNSYGYCVSSVMNRVDPEGEAPIDPGIASQCRRVLQGVIAAWSLAGNKCAADLLAASLRRRPDPCPTSCADALNRNGFGFVTDCLASRMSFSASCGKSTSTDFELSGEHYFGINWMHKGAGGTEGDLGYAFGHFSWRAKGRCRSDCGNASNGCCCHCTASCGFDIQVGPDTYNFDPKKYSAVIPHPIACIHYLQENGDAKVFDVTCRLPVYGISIGAFKRCPGPPLPDSMPCSPTQSSPGNPVSPVK
jgi:RHS repeat-associated protein